MSDQHLIRKSIEGFGASKSKVTIIGSSNNNPSATIPPTVQSISPNIEVPSPTPINTPISLNIPPISFTPPPENNNDYNVAFGIPGSDDIIEPLTPTPLKQPAKRFITNLGNALQPDEYESTTGTELSLATMANVYQSDDNSIPFTKKNKPTSLTKNAVIFTAVMLIAAGAYIAFGKTILSTAQAYFPKINSSTTSSNSFTTDAKYSTWSQKYFQKLVDPSSDNDNDQLTNAEEYLIGSDPSKTKSCDGVLTDSQQLYNFVDPSVCKPIDFSNVAQTTKFSNIIQFQRLDKIIPAEEVKPVTNDELATLFGVSTLDKISYDSDNSITEAKETLDKKQSYISDMKKMADYMKTFRSYGPYDRSYEIPVHPAVFLDVSLRYNSPLKYMMAIARLESRFGTDRYDDSGALTRPGEHKNMYSLGLTDSGSNVTFDTWATGVESFGKWYAKLEKAGISNCAKWKIYNPNGDYCGKVEETAKEYEAYGS
jgi:hypothetical protein